jgi:hypothetical protein
MVEAVINYVADTPFRQRYYANDHSRDTVVIDPRPMSLFDGRVQDTELDREGFRLVTHRSEVRDFLDRDLVSAIYPDEIAQLVRQHTGADSVVVTAPAIIRFSEASGKAGSLDNSMPARFVHIDASAATSAMFAARLTPEGQTLRRYAHYNVWRSFSGAPQDVPLALCDARSVSSDDRKSADAIFDPPDGAAEWSFESWIITHNPAHRWHWFPDMSGDEAIIFKTSDSLQQNPVPHVAFDNRLAPNGCHPRISIEMRVFACWFD